MGRTNLLFAATLLMAACAQAQDFDLLLTGGRIVDGSGNPWYRADIGISRGRIAAIGNLAGRKANRTIAVNNQVISPGFIDMMGNTTLPFLTDRDAAQSKLRQGITTLLAGEGHSDAPTPQWHTFAEYFRALERKGMPMNAVYNVGAAQVRIAVLGDKDVSPTAAQQKEMNALVEQAMKDGAVGLSTALIYPPGTYARTEELVEMAKVVGRFNGVYVSHMRNESNRVLDAIRETIHIGEAAGIPSHVFHLKAAGEENWPLINDAIGLIQASRDRGLDVTADIYPYIRNGIGLGSFLHPKYYANGTPAFLKTLSDATLRKKLRAEVETTSDWENWYRHVGSNWDNVLVAHVGAGLDKGYEAHSLAEIAKMRRQDEWTTFFDLVRNGTVEVNPRSMNEEQKAIALRTPWVSICTDAEPLNIQTATNAHPRAFGAFTRVLAKYVREDKVITLEQAVRQMSSLPANFLRLYDRGRIASGMAADLLVFDPDKVQDTATFQKPLSFPAGMPYVIVNGKVAIDNGKFSAENSGQVLRHQP